jgi:hypothetical protein
MDENAAHKGTVGLFTTRIRGLIDVLLTTTTFTPSFGD